MSTITQPHGEPSSQGMEEDLRRITADDATIAPSEIAVGVIIGRASEYFDFFVYGIASVLVFPAVFFPFESRLEGTLLSFIVFSFAFIARPLGTVTFMAIQQRYGRGVKLTMSLFLLGISTAGMAFLPSYASLGFTSIVLLSVFRFCQGIALGGSWDGLPSLLALSAPPKRRGWYAMIPQLGAPIGFIIASGLFLFLHANLSTADFLDWGWRYTFYVAFAINVVALFARLRLVVTDEYERLLKKKELEPANVMEMVRSRSGSNMLIGAFAALASYALFHVVTVFPLSWITLKSDQPVNDVLVIQMFGAALCIVGVMASGRIADRVGRRSTLGATAVLIAVFSVFTLGLCYGQAAGAVSSNFLPKYRYTGAALTSDLAWLIGAAFAPLTALGLSARFGLVAVSIYLLSGALCTLIALRVNRALEIRD